MPLRVIELKTGLSVHAWNLDSEGWKQLSDRNRLQHHLVMPCCQASVVLRRSIRGTAHFVHKQRGPCTTAPESAEHIELKSIVAQAAMQCGWSAETEVCGQTPTGDKWKADVMLTKDRAKIAVEVQLTNQTYEETLRRQARYHESGVRGLWLVRRGIYPPTKKLPFARLAGSQNDGYRALLPTGEGTQELRLEDFIRAALSRRLRFGLAKGGEAILSLEAGSMECWQCGKKTSILTGIFVDVGPKGYEFDLFDLSNQPQLAARVLQQIPNSAKLGSIKRRYSHTMKAAYLSNGCSHCDSLMGHHFEHRARENTWQIARTPVVIDDFWYWAIKRNSEHRNGWCVYEK